MLRIDHDHDMTLLICIRLSHDRRNQIRETKQKLDKNKYKHRID